MSDFQIGLVVLGALVLLAVLVQSLWTARANAPRQADNSGDAGEHDGKPNFTEPVFDDSGFTNLNLAVSTPRRPAIDSLIDAVAAVNLDPMVSAVSGDAAVAAFPGSWRVGSKAFLIEGFNADAQEWETPVPGARYMAFQTAVQLANRAGALNDIEYSEFVVKTQAFADAMNATPEFREMRDEVARAKELDHFASQNDAQLGLNLRARHAAWSPGYIAQVAAQHGFVAGQLPGRMVLPASADGLPPLLALTFDSQAALAEDPAQSAIFEIVFHMDVPQVDRAEQAFERMCHAAQAMAQTMDGIVTDDNGQALPVQALESISHELQQLYDRLAERDYPAGSALARRLFS